MAILDFRRTDTPTEHVTDVCLIGSGLAAWPIADLCRRRGLDVLVVESGGLDRGPEGDAMDAIECVGQPLCEPGRSRLLGGTSRIWGGRCKAFDAIDYERRDWVPRSGWPIGPADVEPHLDAASVYLGAGPWPPDERGPTGAAGPAADPALLNNSVWEDPHPADVGPRFAEAAAQGLHILVHATATHLVTDPDGRRLDTIEIATTGGRTGTVRARATVLCAGGIENARLLLQSDRHAAHGVGNAHDQVGRNLIEHPRDPQLIVRFDPRDHARVRSLFGPYRRDTARGRNGFVNGFAMSPERQRRDRLLNCAAWPIEITSPDDPIAAASRLRGGSERPARDIGLILSQPGILARALHARLVARQRVRRRVERIGLLVSSEQVPDPESRITLGEARDALGQRRARVDWRIHEIEAASQAALAIDIAREMARLGLPTATLADWVREGRLGDAHFIDGCHPSGTTRMAADPREGVVDADCKVHGVDGLYVAGSSVFPTIGHANPTLMIGALALRLAHHLCGRLRPAA